MNRKERRTIRAIAKKDGSPRKKHKHMVPEKESAGLGDTLSKFIKKVGKGKIKECKGCEKRKELLNRMIPYNKKDKKEDDIEQIQND